MSDTLPLFLIVWLGNPWPEYAHTKHNIGWVVLDHLLQKLALWEQWSLDKQFHWWVIKTTLEVTSSNQHWFGRSMPLGRYRLIIAKPSTFMNLSGGCVAPLMQFFKIPSSHLLVIHDDLDQPAGSYKFKKKGSSWGQNGIKDIIKKIGTDEFYRLKIGIGRSDHAEYDIVRWVLSKIDDNQIKQIEELTPSFIRSVWLFLQGKI